MLEKQKWLDSTSVSQTMTEIETLLCRWKVSNTLENNQEKQQPDYSDIPPELIKLLRNPSIRALLTPPTQLEIEVKEMVEGKRPAPAKYPTHKAKDKQPPVEFLKQYYGKYLDEGCLYLDQLRMIDIGLVQALKNWDSYRGKSDSAIIPRGRARADKLLDFTIDYLRDRIEYLGVVLNGRKHHKIEIPIKNQN